jgi:hypothetical protein
MLARYVYSTIKSQTCAILQRHSLFNIIQINPTHCELRIELDVEFSAVGQGGKNKLASQTERLLAGSREKPIGCEAHL